MRNRFKVSLEILKKSAPQVLTTGTSIVSHVNGNSFFATPHPALASVTTALTELATAIDNAIGGGTEETSIRNDKRLIVQNLLTELSQYVEGIANDPANVSQAETIILSAGMLVKRFTPRVPEIFAVKQGNLFGTLKVTAARVRRGSHEWQYTTTPLVESSWVDAPPTTKAKITLTGLTRGALMYVRHRAVTKHGATDWETSDGATVL